MKRYLLILLVAGCANRQAVVEAQTDAAFEECAGIFTPGTQAHFNCTRDTVNRQQPGKPVLKRDETTSCVPDGLGGVRCTKR